MTQMRKLPLKQMSINYEKGTGSSLVTAKNSWHYKPLIKQIFRSSHVKSHLTSKSIEVLEHELSLNQRLTISEIIRSKIRNCTRVL